MAEKGKKKNTRIRKFVAVCSIAACAAGFLGKSYIVYSNRFEQKVKVVWKKGFHFHEVFINLDQVMNRRSNDRLKDLIESIEWMKKHPEIKAATSTIDWTAKN